MVNPIHYGDIVGFSHPGSRGRIGINRGQEFIHFKFTGGTGLVKNGSEVIITQEPQQYYLIAPDQKWKLTTNDANAVNNGTIIKLDPIGGNAKEFQLYLVYKLRIDPIEHVVLLMLENRSFFRVYGYMDPNRDSYVNYSESGKAFTSSPSDDLDTPDPPHEIPFVNITLEGEKSSGYIKSYEKYHKQIGTKNITDADLQDIMGYTKKGFLPTLHKMEEFACICSQWYCSMRGPTWPNRMFALSGSSFGWKTTPEMNPNILHDLKSFLGEWTAFKPRHPQRTSIFDVLKDKHTSYNVFTDNPVDFSLSANVFYPSQNDSGMKAFKEQAKEGKLPHFSFLEPNYINMPSLGFVQNDDHPPSNPLKAQEFIAEVYETLRTSPKWNNTLFIITYDEHGGFFDPVVPPAAVVPDESSKDEAGTFAKYGARVPTVLVSPCVAHGIDHTLYDHTSVLKYVLEKWAPDSLDHLGLRTLHANSLPVMATPREDKFPPIREKEFEPARSFRAAHKPESEDHVPSEKLSVPEAAAKALKDVDTSAKLRTILIEKRLAKSSPESEVVSETSIVSVDLHPTAVFAAPTPAPTPEMKSEHKDTPIGTIAHAMQDAMSKVANSVESLFANNSNTRHAPITPAAPQGVVTTATTGVIIDASEAERYADDILRRIRQGIDAQSVADPRLSADIYANQIRAICFLLEKSPISNDLARTYINLLQVRAKKHSTKVVAKGKAY